MPYGGIRHIRITHVTMLATRVRVWFIMRNNNRWDFCRGDWDSDAFPITGERYLMYRYTRNNTALFTLRNRQMQGNSRRRWSGTLIKITNCTVIGRNLGPADAIDSTPTGSAMWKLTLTEQLDYLAEHKDTIMAGGLDIPGLVAAHRRDKELAVHVNVVDGTLEYEDGKGNYDYITFTFRRAIVNMAFEVGVIKSFCPLQGPKPKTSAAAQAKKPAKNPNRVAAGKKLWAEGRSGLQQLDVVDAPRKRRASPATSKTTYLPGRADPLNLTGKSGLFCQHKMEKIGWEYSWQERNQEFTDNLATVNRITFFNDPLTDPSFLMMLAMQGLQKKFKRPKVELLKIWGCFPNGVELDVNDSGVASFQKWVAIFDQTAEPVLVGASGGGGMEPFLPFDGISGTNMHGNLTWSDGNILITEKWLNESLWVPTGADTLSIKTQTDQNFEVSFMDNAGHGILLDGTVLQVVTGYWGSGNKARQDKQSDSTVHAQPIHFLYRTHYVELLEDEINELLQKQNSSTVTSNVFV